MRNAIAAGVFNDLGSGSNIDLCIITNGHVDYLRNYEIANVKPPIQTQYTFPRGTTGRRWRLGVGCSPCFIQTLYLNIRSFVP